MPTIEVRNSEQGRACYRVDRKVEYGNAERRDDRTAADAVGSADDSDEEGQQKHGWNAEAEALSPELVFDHVEIKGDGLDNCVGRKPGRAACECCCSRICFARPENLLSSSRNRALLA